MALTLDTLHGDVLDEIFGNMYFPYMYIWDQRWYNDCIPARMPAAGLLPLSLVCKRLRAQTAPWIFRDINFYFVKPSEFIPINLAQYIHVLRYYQEFSIDDEQPKSLAVVIETINSVTQQIRHFPHVHTIHLWALPLSSTLIRAISSLPGLLTLVLYNYPLLLDGDFMFNQLRGIRRLLHVDEEIRNLRRDYLPRHDNFGRCLLSVAESTASSLVHLDVPAQFVRPEALGRMQLTMLHILVLRGRIESPSPNSFLALLDAAPNLRVLEVHLFVANEDTPRFTIMTEDFDISLTGRQIPLLSNLREFTLANADPSDYIFRHLPPDLQILSLPPIIFLVRSRRKSQFALSANTAAHVLSRCSLFGLPELKISIEGELPPWLFYTIAKAFPSLQRLEVRHRFCVDEDNMIIKEAEYSPESYAVAFAAFSHLRVLNLDWPMTNEDSPDSYPPIPRGRTREPPPPLIEMSSFAALVAPSVPTLVEVRFRESMLETNDRFPWRPFTISRCGTDSDSKVTELDNTRPDRAEMLRVEELRTES